MARKVKVNPLSVLLSVLLAVELFGIVGAVGNCKGGSLAGYGNGQVPTSVLCPLYGAPGHMLRADAAKAFNDMSGAFQVVVKATRQHHSRDQLVLPNSMLHEPDT